MRRPADVFPPGEFLLDELEARGWSQVELAEILGRPAGLITDIVKGRRGISAETANGLAAAFGTSADYWMNLESMYQLSKLNDDGSETIARRAKLYEKAPIKDMARRGWIVPDDNIDVFEHRFCTFFGINSVDDELEIPLHAARKSTDYRKPLTAAQTAWLLRARQLARAALAQAYSSKNLPDVIVRLQALRQIPQEIRNVPKILSDAGIRLVIVQGLPGNKIDGACFWVNEAPVIAIALRFDRIDHFWFVLFHELGHVQENDESVDIDLDTQEADNLLPNSEREANAFAQDHVLPQQQLSEFISRIGPLYSQQKIEAFAYTMHVHPGIVVGQLHHKGEIPYPKFRKFLVPVREWITASTLTDGWDALLSADL